MYHTRVGSACGLTSLKIFWEADSPKRLLCKTEPSFDTEYIDVTGLGHGPVIFRFALGNTAVTDYHSERNPEN